MQAASSHCTLFTCTCTNGFWIFAKTIRGFGLQERWTIKDVYGLQLSQEVSIDPIPVILLHGRGGGGLNEEIE